MNIDQKMVFFFFEKAIKAYFKVIMLSLKICEKIIKFNFLMGVLGILTVYANTLKWSFIDEKKKKKRSVLNLIGTPKHL